LFENFELAASNLENIECWSARDLQLLLGYSQWRNFENTIQKAKESCRNAGQNMKYHFADVSKVIEAGKGTKSTYPSYKLSCYSCYL
jgi:DNA-damage-inducible protein D